MQKRLLLTAISLVVASVGFYNSDTYRAFAVRPITVSPSSLQVLISDEARKVSQRLSFENTSSKAISVIGIKTPCSCMTAEVPFELAPGEVKQIEFTVDGASYKKSFSENSSILFYTNNEEVTVSVPLEILCKVSTDIPATPVP